MKNSKHTNPSQEEQPHNRPQPGPQKQEQPKEGDIRKVEGSVPEDDNVIPEEDSLKSDARTEDESDTSVKRDAEEKNRRAR